MGLLNAISRLALREKVAIREIARRTGLSRNTIKKYLKAGTVEPTFLVPERACKLDPFADKLAGWLKAEAFKSRKQRRTLKHMHADLVALGFTGSYNRVAAFAREWRAERQREQQTTGRGVFVPLSFRPGEAFQFDWSEDYAVLGGHRTKLQVAHIKLAYRRAFLVRAYLLQTHELLFDAQWQSWSPVSGQFLLGVKLGPDQFTPPNTVCPPFACMPRRVSVPRARNAGVVYCSNRSSVRSRPWPRCRSRKRGDRRIRISVIARAVR
ncbi:hypothetical protein GCM10011317_07410 [Niveispirillum cyanobacteriorum]|nr:hypothetical protein GCM10011317_07410 [Niveispirillum cyanobacteriorum]